MGDPTEPLFEPFVDGQVWTGTAPLRFMGLPVGMRMTVARLDGDRLWVHSPLPSTPERTRALRALGQPVAAVAPNALHHLYIGEFAEQFEVPIYGSRRLPAKRPDVSFEGVLGDQPPPEWAGQIDQVALGGTAKFDEVAFLHRATGTLVLTDLCMHVDEPGFVPQLAARFAGIRHEHAMPREFRMLMWLHKAEFKHVIDVILSWDFDRMIVSHGPVVPEGARAVVERAYAFARDW